MKRKVTGVIIGVGAIGAVIFFVVWTVASSYLARQPQLEQTCPQTGITYEVQIKHNIVSPAVLHAALCDTLTITNADTRFREIAFGPHDNHEAYDGVAEKGLAAGQSLTVTLAQAGTFTFHDHLQEQVQGQFVVQQ